MTNVADDETSAVVSVRFSGIEHYLGQMQTAMECALEDISDIGDSVMAEVRFITWKEDGKRHWSYNLTAVVGDAASTRIRMGISTYGREVAKFDLAWEDALRQRARAWDRPE